MSIRNKLSAIALGMTLPAAAAFAQQSKGVCGDKYSALAEQFYQTLHVDHVESIEVRAGKKGTVTLTRQSSMDDICRAVRTKYQDPDAKTAREEKKAAQEREEAAEAQRNYVPGESDGPRHPRLAYAANRTGEALATIFWPPHWFRRHENN